MAKSDLTPKWMRKYSRLMFWYRVWKYGIKYYRDKNYRKSIKNRSLNARRVYERPEMKYRSYANATHRAKRKILGNRTWGWCNLCRQKIDRSELTIDHKVQRGKGGTNEKSNLQIICKKCHLLKDRQIPKSEQFIHTPFKEAFKKL